MGKSNAVVPALTDALTEADAVAAGVKGRVITVDSAYGPKVYKMVKNGHTTLPISAGQIVQITDMAANEVKPKATLHEKLFGGVRPVGADDIEAFTGAAAKKVWGYVQILGYASGMEGDTCAAITAGDLIVPDDDADLGRVGGALTVPVSNSAANIGLYGDCHDSAFAVAKANSAGVADTAVLMNIFRNFWGASA